MEIYGLIHYRFSEVQPKIKKGWEFKRSKVEKIKIDEANK